MRTSNPTLREDTFAPANWGGISAELTNRGDSAVMTMNGTVAKTAFLLLLCIASAIFAFQYTGVNPGLSRLLVVGGAIGGFVLSLVISFVPKTAPFLSPVYAVAQGLVMGAISLAVAGSTKAGTGLVLQAVSLTLGIFAALLVGYALGLIRMGSVLTKCVVVATFGVCLTYLANWVLGMFGIHILGAIHGSGAVGIGFSVVVVVLASLNLVLDFQFIEGGVRSGAPKYMEWYGGFGLLVTLIWLYIEVLRLLSKLNRR